MSRWKYLLSSMITMLFLGVLYAWSILKAPFSEEFFWSAGQLGLNFTLTISVFSLGVFAGGQLLLRFSVRRLLLPAAALVFLGFWGCSLLSGRSPLPLYLLYGCLCGFAIGVAYNVIVSATLAWFGDRRGLCSGLLMMCFGASTLLLGTLASAMFRGIGWRAAYRVIAAVMAAALLSSAFLLKRKDGPEQARRTGRTDVYKKGSFWLFCLYTVALAAGASMVISFAKDISLEIGLSDGLATALVGVLAVCNGLGRLLCGVLSDRCSTTRVMVTAGVLAAAAALALLCAVFFRSGAAGVAGMCATGVAYGFSPTIMSGFVAKTYGMEHFSVNFSLTSFTLIPCSFAAAVGGAMVAGTGGFSGALTLSLILALASIALGAAAGVCARREAARPG